MDSESPWIHVSLVPAVGYTLLVYSFLTAVALGCMWSTSAPSIAAPKAAPAAPGGQKDSIVLVIAHPDDEAMFFVPSILHLRQHFHVHVLCLSNGMARREQPGFVWLAPFTQTPQGTLTGWGRCARRSCLPHALACSGARLLMCTSWTGPSCQTACKLTGPPPSLQKRWKNTSACTASKPYVGLCCALLAHRGPPRPGCHPHRVACPRY